MTPASKSARAPKPTAGQKAKAASDAHKTVARNRKATHDYFIEDRYEAGLVLTGTEVKALRMGRASLTEAWIELDRHGEAWLQGAHIPEYLQGTWNNHSPRRKRKLGPGQGLHSGPAGAVLHRRARQAGDRPGSRKAGLGQATGAA